MGATMVKPSKKPMRREPWVTTCESGSVAASVSKRPLEILRSGVMERR